MASSRALKRYCSRLLRTQPPSLPWRREKISLHRMSVLTGWTQHCESSMSRRPPDDPKQIRQAIINGNMAWTLESVLAPPARSPSTRARQTGASTAATGIQRLTTTTGPEHRQYPRSDSAVEGSESTSAVTIVYDALLAVAVPAPFAISRHLRAVQYHIAAISEDAGQKHVTVRVRPNAERTTSSAVSNAQLQQAGTEYTFVLALSHDRRQIAKVNVVVHGPES